MSEEESFLPKLEKRAAKNETLPIAFAQMFLDGTLGDGMPTIYEGENEKAKTWERVWRIAEVDVNLPGHGPALMRIDYHKEFNDVHNKELFIETVRFDLMTKEKNPRGLHDRISEMWWSRPGPGNPDKYPNDLRNGHRYTVPEFRDIGAAKFTYDYSERWAQQLADIKGGEFTLAFATDQPDTMDWAEKRNYTPYPEEAETRQEIKDHIERFALVPGDPLIGQQRNLAAYRNGEAVRLWFRKVLKGKS